MSSFNPRAREGRDCSQYRGEQCRKVSIHAPARGATFLPYDNPPKKGVSIHAPARGATFDVKTNFGASLFQSTRPRGARLCFPSPSFASSSVSIHAPARGATTPSPSKSCAAHCFNPRAREGRDAARRIRAGHDGVSIHAPARGATLQSASLLPRDGFQSTRPRGARLFQGV